MNYLKLLPLTLCICRAVLCRPQTMDILRHFQNISWCKPDWCFPSMGKETNELLQQCTNLPKLELSVDVDEIIKKSKAFPVPFPIESVRLEKLKVRRPIEKLKKNIESTYPLIHERVLLIMTHFLIYKREFGTSIEKALYKDMTVPQLIDRILTKRAVVFMTENDNYKLITGEEGTDGWDSVGTLQQRSPLTLENVLSYDEMKISSMVYVSGMTECINNGDRHNRGVVSEEDAQSDAVVIGIIGPRFERKFRMDYEDVIINPQQNCPENGYGEEVTPTTCLNVLKTTYVRNNQSARHMCRQLWAEFYQVHSYTYEELTSYVSVQDKPEQDKCTDRYVKLPAVEDLFDNEVYYKRLCIIAECVLLEAEERASTHGKNAFVNIIGAGLGVRKVSPHQPDVYILTFLERIRAFLKKDLLNHVTDVNFAYIKPSDGILALFTNSSSPTKPESPSEKRIFFESKRHPKGGINVQLENRNPSAKLTGEHEGKLLVITYPWDGNAHPGNEFWLGSLDGSGDPTAASSTQVAELHNAHINPAVSALNTRIAVIKMSSSGQWRFIRHYLSMTNLHAEVEKLVQKLKPVTPEQWDNLIRRFEKAVSIRLSSAVKDIQVTKEESPTQQQSPTKQQSLTQQQSQVQQQSATQQRSPQKIKEIDNAAQKMAQQVVKKQTDEFIKRSSKEKGDEKISQDGLTIGSEAKEITIKGIWQGLKLKKDLTFGKISDQSWKTSKPIVTKTSIHSRTAYVISAIVAAETPVSLMKRTESFIDHLKQYPEARDYAIKEGGVRALLRVKHKLRDNGASSMEREVIGIVSEALALMGYTGPTKGPGPHILSIDGGGIRGMIAIEILRHLERMTGKRVNEMFDYIIGVSTGAIIAAVIGSGVGTLETADEMYRTLSKKMFGNTSIIGGASRLVWTHSYYDTDAWEKMLQENLKDCTLTQCNRYNTPKMALVSCVVNSGSKLTPFLFRSYECGFRVRSVFPGTSSAKVWHAVRASAAAPTYFNEFRLDGLLHQDGGIMVNNPTGVGLHEAKLLFGPNALKNATVISVGTGKALTKHLDYHLMSKSMAKDQSGTSWRDKFNKILDSATDTEGIHFVLNDLLPPGNYYRFNPPLMEQCAMDEVDPVKLESMLTDTRAYMRRNQHKLQQAASMLVRKRSLTKRAVDYLQYQSQLMGVLHNH